MFNSHWCVATWREGRAHRIPAMVKAHSKVCAAARADRRCANPDRNKPLGAQRSTNKFCGRCPSAFHHRWRGVR
jgi:hypothetical protein